MGASKYEIVIIILMIIGLLWIQDARANDMRLEYATDIVEYIQTKDRILPENTKFKCECGVLYKSGYVQYWYTGKAQTCIKVQITRQEYEISIINSLF